MNDDVGVSPYAGANPVSRLLRGPGRSPITMLYAKLLPPIDRFVSRVTQRRKTLTGSVSGLQVLLLTTTGAKTGARRTSPVMYLRTGEDFVVIASNWGKARNPAWYYNLRATPLAQVTLSGSTFDVTAREVTGSERGRYWRHGLVMYPGWNVYKARSPDRQFPIMLLSRPAAG